MFESRGEIVAEQLATTTKRVLRAGGTRQEAEYAMRQDIKKYGYTKDDLEAARSHQFIEEFASGFAKLLRR
ncbi:hypothetical protein [Streptomyces sp. HNM0574]|uniref:hypothetical protein n=1 Tax=Streptomyces sp. HNM0574 TaxID=2714954 RepID=UPI00146E7395|nr:hypothetical protein [Streptomyces sp. HNM0574]NLU68483.1 hypothetical protein [Streptomyces sp. HNM0574]